MRTAVTRYATPALLALGVILAITNWYLRPDRSLAWAIALGFLAFLVAPLWIARRRARLGEGSSRQAADWISGAVGLATLMMVLSLSGMLAQALGVTHSQDLAQRLTMVLAGGFLAAIGNVMPKMLPPSSAMACDGGKAQALRRLSGWTWVLTGLAYAVIWLSLPIDQATWVSTMVVLVGMLAVTTQMFRLWKTRRREA